MSDAKVILVTGASSGNGRATARLLAQRGHRVFGTSRNPAGAEKSPNVELVALDVQSDASVAACVKSVLDQAGRLDVLINNAGYELGGALEEISLDEARAQFETNFFGVARATKAVLPAMRRQQRGQIINISSLAGVAPIPFMGMYSASKHALEGYTEALRHEVQPFGIRISLVQVGFLNTPMMNARQLAAQRISAYDPWRQRALDAIRGYEEKGPGPELVAQAVARIVDDSSPGLRHVVGQEAIVVSSLKRFLPERLFEKGARSNFRLDAGK